jgi:hypothetical protein
MACAMVAVISAVLLGSVLALPVDPCEPLSNATALCVLSAEEFVRVTSTTLGNPAYWVIRIRAPWDAVPSTDLLAEAAADLAAGGVHAMPFVHFGELLLNTPDAWTIADALGLQQFPTVIAYSGKTLRAMAPRGALQYGKVLALPRPIQIPSPTSSKGKEALIKTVLSSVPTRYLDGVTGHYLEALHFVFSRKEVYQLSALRNDQVQVARVVSVLPKRAVVLRLRLSEKGDEAMLAAASAAAAESGSNTMVFVTEDADVANRFQISSVRQGAVFEFPFPDDVSVPIVPLMVSEASGFGTPADVAGFMLQAAAGAPAPCAEEATQAALTSWRRDINTIMKEKQVVKLNSQSEFFTNVEDCKVSIVILFFLRESDDFFMRGYHVAEDLAKAIQTQWSSRNGESDKSRQHPLAATRDRVRFETYWIDAEVQKSVASAFKIPSVPSVAFLYNLQDGRRGVRFVLGGKKHNEFPTVAELLTFMSGPSLMDPNTRDMFPVDLSTVSFLPEEEVAQFYRGKSPKQLRVTIPGAPALVTDRKVYPQEDAKESNFVSQLIEGKIKLGESSKSGESSESGATSSTPTSSKVSAKAAAKKAKKQEATKKRLEEELSEKRRLKEERIKKKAEEDAKRREEDKAKAKAALRQERKKHQASTNEGDASSPLTSTRSDTVVGRPKFNPAMVPRNLHVQKRDWDVDRKEMMRLRLKTGGGSVSFDTRFEL